MAELASQPDLIPSGWRAYLPGVALITSYQRKWLPRDIAAGLVLSALLVPQGMAYADLAGLPPVTGLYTSILCLLGYAIFGPSRILVLGPDSALGPMIAATIAPCPAHFFRTLDEAVAEYARQTGAAWESPGAAS